MRRWQVQPVTLRLCQVSAVQSPCLGAPPCAAVAATTQRPLRHRAKPTSLHWTRCRVSCASVAVTLQRQCRHRVRGVRRVGASDGRNVRGSRRTSGAIPAPHVRRETCQTSLLFVARGRTDGAAPPRLPGRVGRCRMRAWSGATQRCAPSLCVTRRARPHRRQHSRNGDAGDSSGYSGGAGGRRWWRWPGRRWCPRRLRTAWIIMSASPAPSSTVLVIITAIINTTHRRHCYHQQHSSSPLSSVALIIIAIIGKTYPYHYRQLHHHHHRHRHHHHHRRRRRRRRRPRRCAAIGTGCIAGTVAARPPSQTPHGTAPVRALGRSPPALRAGPARGAIVAPMR